MTLTQLLLAWTVFSIEPRLYRHLSVPILYSFYYTLILAAALTLTHVTTGFYLNHKSMGLFSAGGGRGHQPGKHG